MSSICYDNYGRRYSCGSSGWYSWGRWVLFGVIILAFAALFFCVSCITARRRRKAGRKPMYGTGWVPAGGAASQPGYNPSYNQQQSAPAYNSYNQAPNDQQAGGYYGGANQSYFGGQQTGVEVPNKAYQPPSGPPPAKY